MRMPETDFMLCLYLLPVAVQKDAKIDALKSLWDKLETCEFKVLWAWAHCSSVCCMYRSLHSCFCLSVYLCIRVCIQKMHSYIGIHVHIYARIYLMCGSIDSRSSPQTSPTTMLQRSTHARENWQQQQPQRVAGSRRSRSRRRGKGKDAKKSRSGACCGSSKMLRRHAQDKRGGVGGEEGGEKGGIETGGGWGVKEEVMLQMRWSNTIQTVELLYRQFLCK